MLNLAANRAALTLALLGKIGMKFFRQVGDFVKIVVISLLIIIPIRYFVAQPFFVRGSSMDPTFKNGEYLIIDELSYRFHDVARGDVIVFRFPLNPSQFYIKRVVGLSGETVKVQGGQVQIYAESGEEIPLDESSYLSSTHTAGDIEIVLDEGEHFVLGDNRNASSDSRRWGALKENFIVGKVFLRAWPVDRFMVY